MPDITVTRADLAKAVHQQVGLSFNESDQNKYTEARAVHELAADSDLILMEGE